MNILIWNIRGITGKQSLIHLKKLINCTKLWNLLLLNLPLVPIVENLDLMIVCIIFIAYSNFFSGFYLSTFISLNLHTMSYNFLLLQ